MGDAELIPARVISILQDEFKRAKGLYPDAATPYESLGIVTEQYYDLLEVFRMKQGNANQEFLELAVVSLRHWTDVLKVA